MVNFSRANRLKTKREFQFVFDQPRKVTHKYFLALFKSSRVEHPKLGIMVNKRFLKRAVDRNRLKRVIRESFRLYQTELKELDIIILLRSECSGLDKKIWRDDIDKLWQLVIAKKC